MGEKIKVNIAAMRPEDLDQVLAIEQASFSMPWSRQLFVNELRHSLVSTLLVALVDRGASVGPAIDREPSREVAGYIIFWVVSDEAHILNLATAPAYRRQGIAKKLVVSALAYAYAKGARRAYLEVRASNAAAQKLYSSLGFTGDSVRRNYYDEPVEDAIIMSLGPGAYHSLVKRGRDR